jgi:hypothetical protein
LLELAAKAAGYKKIEYHNLKGSMLDFRYGRDEAIWNDEDYWNPLVDDGEALRLAVRLRLDVMCHELGAHVDNELSYHAEISHTDPYAAARRAIVSAAAEIGKGMIHE